MNDIEQTDLHCRIWVCYVPRSATGLGGNSVENRALLGARSARRSRRVERGFQRLARA